MDAVLTGATPRLTATDAVELGATLFGVRARAGRDLGSERDRAFLLHDDGAAVAVLKVSNSAEDPGVLDMEAAAALRVSAVDASLRVALPWRPLATADPGPARPDDDPVRLRAEWQGHWVRLYDVLPGNSRIAATELSDAALVAWGETTARLGVALRGFAHPRAQRVMAWDVQHALAARAMLADIRDPHARAAVARVLDEFERRVTPVWPRLRAQVLHADLTVDNTLTDDAGLITGIVDFGDMSHTALVADLAAVLDSVAAGGTARSCSAPPAWSSTATGGASSSRTLELEVLGVAWAARCAVTIAISSWRVAQGLEEQAFAERYNAVCLRDDRDDGGRRVGRRGPRGSAPRDRRCPMRRWPRGARRRSARRSIRCSMPSRSRSRTPKACGSPTPRGAGISTPTTTCRASGTRIRGCPRRSRARAGGSTPTRGICIRRRSGSRSG